MIKEEINELAKILKEFYDRNNNSQEKFLEYYYIKFSKEGIILSRNYYCFIDKISLDNELPLFSLAELKNRLQEKIETERENILNEIENLIE